MIPKGVQNLEEALASCQDTLDSLGHDADPEWRQVLASIIAIGQDLKTKFFFKTNLAIPATNACRKHAHELKEIASGAEIDRFAEVLGTLKRSVEDLLDGADMGGIVIT